MLPTTANKNADAQTDLNLHWVHMSKGTFSHVVAHMFMRVLPVDVVHPYYPTAVLLVDPNVRHYCSVPYGLEEAVEENCLGYGSGSHLHSSSSSRCYRLDPNGSPSSRQARQQEHMPTR